MDLKTRVKHYLNGLRKDRTIYVFPSELSQCSLLGSAYGQLVCFLVIESSRPLTMDEIKFKAKIEQSGGEFYTIRDMEDLFLLAKERGWL